MWGDLGWGGVRGLKACTTCFFIPWCGPPSRPLLPCDASRLARSGGGVASNKSSMAQRFVSFFGPFLRKKKSELAISLLQLRSHEKGSPIFSIKKTGCINNNVSASNVTCCTHCVHLHGTGCVVPYTTVLGSSNSSTVSLYVRYTAGLTIKAAINLEPEPLSACGGQTSPFYLQP